jgi:hypothetical protein
MEAEIFAAAGTRKMPRGLAGLCEQRGVALSDDEGGGFARDIFGDECVDTFEQRAIRKDFGWGSFLGLLCDEGARSLARRVCSWTSARSCLEIAAANSRVVAGDAARRLRGRLALIFLPGVFFNRGLARI